MQSPAETCNHNTIKNQQPTRTSNAPQPKETAAPSARWWQWFFLYPTFGIALLTAAPDWIDRGSALAMQLLHPNQPAETRLVRFMKDNPECVAAPLRWVDVSDKTKIDGTICSGTGDVWLRILGANGAIAYEGIDISSLIRQDKQSSAFDISAKAAISPVIEQKNMSIPAQPSPVKTAQQFAIVVCQKYTDSTTLLRHLQAGGTCYDEYIDTTTGLVISNNQVQCRSSC